VDLPPEQLGALPSGDEARFGEMVHGRNIAARYDFGARDPVRAITGAVRPSRWSRIRTGV
jgi:hypothetical protein